MPKRLEARRPNANLGIASAPWDYFRFCSSIYQNYARRQRGTGGS